MTGAIRLPAGVVFDMDGTLLSTEALVVPSWIAAFAEAGAELPEQAAIEVIGSDSATALDALRRAVGLELDYPAIQRRCGELFRERAERDGVTVKPGVGRILSGLREARVPIGLATSTRSHPALVLLGRTGLAGRFDAMVFGDEVERRKPHPDIYLLCMERLGIGPTGVWAVEDSRNGILSAHAAGLKVAHIPDLQTMPGHILELVDSVHSSLDELSLRFGVP